MRTNKVVWIDVASELPTKEEFGAYPNVYVALACKGHPDWGYQIRQAELRFFGGDVSRYYWCGSKVEGIAPIENDSWSVKFWTPLLNQPPIRHQTS